MFGTENCIHYNLSKRKRSLCAQFRSGLFLRLRLFKKVDAKQVHYRCDTDILAWQFKYRTFVIADFIEKAWAKRNMSIYI